MIFSALSGCNSSSEDSGSTNNSVTNLFTSDKIRTVTFESDTSGYSYSFHGSSVKKIWDYFSTFTFIRDDSVISDTGMGWNMTVLYENGSTQVITVLPNQTHVYTNEVRYKINSDSKIKITSLIDSLREVPNTPDITASCISEENGAYILILPKSGERIKLENEERLYTPFITDALVNAAENKITDALSKYGNHSEFYLQIKDGYLCLSAEVIKKIDTPVSTDENGFAEGGCGIDHEHLFISERITSTPIDTQSNPPEQENGQKILEYFSEYLTDINFVPELSQGSFISQAEQYIGNTDIVGGLHYDGPHGGGWQLSDRLFGFYNDYTASDDGKSAKYSNRLFTRTELAGLELPYGIKFTDTLKDVFTKIGLKSNLCFDFTPDEGSDTMMTVYRSRTSSLVFENLNLIKTPVDFEFPYVLTYTETYDIKRDNGKSTSVKRTVSFSFGNLPDDTLKEVKIGVEETRQL